MLFFETTKKINFIVCIVIVVVGILGNSITALFLVTRQIRAPKLRAKGVWHKSFSSSQMYIFSIVLSDLLFLLSHFFEDTLPSLSNYQMFQLINRSTIFCKIILYIRNASRISSSYTLTLFAWER